MTVGGIMPASPNARRARVMALDAARIADERARRPHLYKDRGAWIVEFKARDASMRYFLFNTFREACGYAASLDD